MATRVWRPAAKAKQVTTELEQSRAQKMKEKDLRDREQDQRRQLRADESLDNKHTKAHHKGKGKKLSPNSRPRREPRQPATTLSQVMQRKHLVPAVSPMGYEKRFQHLMPDKGQGGVGALKWEEHGKTVTQTVELNEEVALGRDAACQIRISSIHVSDLHLRFHAVLTSSPLALVCMEALSPNGYILNGKRFRPTLKIQFAGQPVSPRLVVLRDGDKIGIPHTDLIMTYKHNKQKYPIVHEPSSIFGDYFLFDSSHSSEEHNTKFWRILNYPLGEGTFGVVNLAEYKSVGLQVACKTIDSRNATVAGGSWRERVEQEVGNMKTLNHPNILRTLDSIKDQVHHSETMDEVAEVAGIDEDDTPIPRGSGVWKAHIIFELATGGDLFSYCEMRRGDMHEDEVKFLSWQLVLGIEHIHSNQVAHRDIKLENVLLYTRGPFPRLLIGDFGASLTLQTLVDRVPSSSLGATSRVIGREGIFIYLPPERLKAFGRHVSLHGLGESLHGTARKLAIGKRWFDEEVQLDIWALGVVMYQMVAADHPYKGEVDRLRGPPKPPKRQVWQVKQEPESFPEVATPESTPIAGPSKPKQQPVPKRKFADLDADDDASETENDIVEPRDWDSFRREHGQGRTGATGLPDEVQVEQLSADIASFKDRSIYDWLPIPRWAEVSLSCRLAISSILQYRAEQRITIPKLRAHEWFTSNQAELDELYEAIVVRSAPR